MPAQQDGSLHGGASFRGLGSAVLASAPAPSDMPAPLLALDSDDERPFAGTIPSKLQQQQQLSNAHVEP